MDHFGYYTLENSYFRDDRTNSNNVVMFTLDKITKMDYPFKEKKGKITKNQANDWIYMSMTYV